MTLVLGASPNPQRVAYQAVYALKEKGEEVVLVGIRQGEVAGETILTTKTDDLQELPPVETLTLYIGAKHQPEWYDFILNLAPKRVIFNPGTENPELEVRLGEANIEAIRACTLVMLSLGQY